MDVMIDMFCASFVQFFATFTKKFIFSVND
jgi:hypothetical protein